MEVFLRLVLFGTVHEWASEDWLALVNDVEGAEFVFGSALNEINGLFVITANWLGKILIDAADGSLVVAELAGGGAGLVLTVLKEVDGEVLLRGTVLILKGFVEVLESIYLLYLIFFAVV